MTTADVGLDDDEILDDDDIDDDEGDAIAAGPRAAARPGPSRRRWLLFATLAIGVLLVDQLTKAWITTILTLGQAPVEVLGSWLRIVHWTNSGILFGLLPQSGPAFAVVSIAVVGLIGLYHARAARGIVITLALGLLLGGALGNLVDRLRFGAVIDWVDMGIGQWRFFTYNVGDAAISTAIGLLLLVAVFPRLADWDAA